MRLNRSTLLAGLCVLVTAAVIGRFYLTPERAVRGAAIDRRGLALRMLGQYLATQRTEGKVLVIGNPFARQPGQPAEVYTFEEVAVEGLEAGLNDRLEVVGVASPALSPRAAADPTAVPMPPDLKTPLSVMTSSGAWDQLAAEHPEADIWVSLIGLPIGVHQMSFWNQPTPRLALLQPDLRVLGDAATVQAAFQSGKLLALLLHRPGAPPQSDAPLDDPQAEFDRRFLLVTEANRDAVLRQFPGLF